MGTPSVSVNICVLRPDASYFSAAVRSILDQSVNDFELIIVEDPSDVDGRALLGDLISDRRIRYIQNTTKTGLIAQRNLALSVSRGEFVSFLDADDIAQPCRLERQIEFLREHHAVHGVGSWIKVIDEHGSIYAERRYPCESRSVRRAMAQYCAMAFPSVTCRLETVRELGGFGGHSLVTDYDLWCKILTSGRELANINEFLTFYRIHRGARTRKHAKEVLRHTIAIKKKYFKDRFMFSDHMVCTLQKILLLSPNWVINFLFRVMFLRTISRPTS